MTFNSIEFVVLFSVVFFLYFALPPRLRNPLLLVASAVFYMWWRPIYIVFVLFSVTVDYFVAFGLERIDTPARRRALLVASLISNLGLLFFFKYFDFASRTLRVLLGLAHAGWEPPILDLVLPIGISFHTFQALSYTIDVYRRQIPVERSLPRLWLYVLFFPQLVAGPIERAKNLLPQFGETHAVDDARAVEGLRLILWGLIKKMVVADHLAAIVNPIYSGPRDYAGWPLLLATYAFAFQIYADFSAYSDIAIGSARVLGFRLMTNFRQPYLAESPTDFWRRWHVSLSTWFRDYVYIPLGGSRSGRAGWVAALMITFLLSGLWHGARWTFVVWGAYHGLLVVASSWSKATLPLPRWIRSLATFHLVAAGWILFRANSLSDAGYILGHLFSAPRTIPFYEIGIEPFDLYLAALGTWIMLLADLLESGKNLPERIGGWPVAARWIAYVAALLLLFNAGAAYEAPFIYFQF